MTARASFFWVTATGLAIGFGCATGTPLATEGDPNADAGGNGDASQQCVPDGPEVCDGVDNNCNGVIDEGFDIDKDTYYQCPRGAIPTDCNDHDPTIHPSATEVCNGVDDNCDGVIDEGFDKDGDGFYECPHPEADGGTLPKDCDDNDPSTYPGAKEICDNKDNDCNGKVDDIPALVTVNDTFSPVNPHWLALGSANINQTLTSWARLTPNTNGQAGAIWWNTTQQNYTFDHFQMDCTIRIVRNPITQGADGMAFVWVPETNADAGAPGVGLAGGGYGLQSLGGFGVALDSYANDGTEPTPPFTAVVSGTSGMHLIRNTTPLGTTAPLLDGASHTLSVSLVTSNIALGDGGLQPQSAVTVTIDGTVFINQFVIPGYVPYAGKWGFTAGTGGFSEEHYVTNISMKFPDGQGCVQ